MTRMWIGLLVAVVIIVGICVGLNYYLGDYLIDDGSWPPSLDVERLLYDAANTYVDSLYETTAEGRIASNAPEEPTESVATAPAA